MRFQDFSSEQRRQACGRITVSQNEKGGVKSNNDSSDEEGQGAVSGGVAGGLARNKHKQVELGAPSAGARCTRRSFHTPLARMIIREGQALQ